MVVKSEQEIAGGSQSGATSNLPHALVALIDGTGLRLMEAFPIGMLTSPLIPRLTYRLQFENGVILKGRHLMSPRRARCFNEVVNAFAADAFSRVMASSREALLEEWVEGRSLSDVSGDSSLIHCSGQFLGRLHTCCQRPLPRPTTSPTDLLRLGEDVQQLQSSSVLSRQEAVDLQHQLQEMMPRKVQRGIIHKDFCGENLIVRPSGAICCIDNLTMSRGPYDFDLARTWYRWPLAPAEWQTFLDGYAKFRSPAEFLQNFGYWSRRVILAAAAFRLKYQIADAESPIKLLRSLLHADIDSRAGSNAPGLCQDSPDSCCPR